LPSSLSATGSSQLHRSGVSDLSKPTQGGVTTIGTFNYFAGDYPTGPVFFAASWKKRTRTLKGGFHVSYRSAIEGISDHVILPSENISPGGPFCLSGTRHKDASSHSRFQIDSPSGPF
jgi:hypothetical protein